VLLGRYAAYVVEDSVKGELEQRSESQQVFEPGDEGTRNNSAWQPA
jgi:hypothetical protein